MPEGDLWVCSLVSTPFSPPDWWQPQGGTEWRQRRTAISKRKSNRVEQSQTKLFNSSRGFLTTPMVERNRARFESANRAVSPVIGVILMVAISVILAAVVGAFVLQVGNQQEKTPSASFSYDQEVRYYADAQDTNLTTVEVTHAGGETIDISQLNIKINGNTSVWGPTGEEGALGFLYRPQPDHFKAATTNEPVPVTSGDQWTINAYKGYSDELVADEEINTPIYGYFVEGYPPTTPGCKAHNKKAYVENPSVKISETDGGSTFNAVCTNRLLPDDELSAVWRSASGGKTQELIGYTVESDGAPGPGSI
jgi:flagellin-like protein